MKNEISPTPSDLGRQMQALRKNRRGRKKVLRICPHCDSEMGTTELSRHIVNCKRMFQSQGNSKKTFSTFGYLKV